MTSETRALLERLFRAGVAAADPYEATRRQLRADTLGVRVWVLAVGKAARPMAEAAIDALADARRSPSGGVVVAPDGAVDRLGPLHVVPGDHPLPGMNSLAASNAVAEVTSLVRPGDDVLVLLSGGATSLMGSPVDGVSGETLVELFDALLRSGAPIATMNALRKRVLRWGAGRLAAAMPGAWIHCYIASDVLGDDLPSIGSGPCVPDAYSARDLIALAEGAGLWASVPGDVRAVTQAAAMGELAETLKPGDHAFDRVESHVVLNNAVAVDGIVAEATALGIAPVNVSPSALQGRAAATGEVIARAALSWSEQLRHSLGAGARACAVWGGETTVSLRADSKGHGGRCQELALACAKALSGHSGVSLLAAGTDGRDGPTDAAGAVVDGDTWKRALAAGVDPDSALEEHDSHRALGAAGALLRSGLTGTNVNDVVIALVERTERDGSEMDSSARQ